MAGADAANVLWQQRYGLADEAPEDTVTDSQALHDVIGIDLTRESVPDPTAPAAPALFA